MNTKKTHESKARRFFSGKGFYIALAVSLVAVGGAAWLGVNSALHNLESAEPQAQENSTTTDEDEWGLPSDYNVMVPQSNVTASSKPVSSAPASSKPVASKGYIMPVEGNIINIFSGDKMVKSKTLNEWVMHTGIDIEAAVSTPVKAIADGKVTEVKNDDMWGTTVTISHAGGIESFYANLKSAVNVKVGQTVRQGDIIGTVGKTAQIEQAEKSHLHFGVKKDGAWIDPQSLIKK